MKLLNPFFKLNKYKNNITSQYGEDGIIEFLINKSKKEIHPSCVEFGAHDGMNSSNDHLFSVIHSQLVTAKPEFTKPPNKLDQIYFNISRFLMSKFGLRSEKFNGPSENVKKAMRQANLYT